MIRPQKSGTEESIVFVLDPTGVVKSLNAAGERLTGYSFAELRCMNVMEILSADSADALRQHVRRSIRNRIGNVFEVEVMTKEGRHVRCETSVDVARGDNGRIEFQGIAVPRSDESAHASRPRCLDEHCVFRFLSYADAEREWV